LGTTAHGGKAGENSAGRADDRRGENAFEPDAKSRHELVSIQRCVLRRLQKTRRKHTIARAMRAENKPSFNVGMTGVVGAYLFFLLAAVTRRGTGTRILHLITALCLSVATVRYFLHGRVRSTNKPEEEN